MELPTAVECRGCGLQAEFGPVLVLPEVVGFLITVRAEVHEWRCRDCWAKTPTKCCSNSREGPGPQHPIEHPEPLPGGHRRA